MRYTVQVVTSVEIETQYSDLLRDIVESKGFDPEHGNSGYGYEVRPLSEGYSFLKATLVKEEEEE